MVGAEDGDQDVWDLYTFQRQDDETATVRLGWALLHVTLIPHFARCHALH
jgi:hypothetical protein